MKSEPISESAILAKEARETLARAKALEAKRSYTIQRVDSRTILLIPKKKNDEHQD